MGFANSLQRACFATEVCTEVCNARAWLDAPGVRQTCSMIRATVGTVARSLHVRLDDASAAALEIIRADGLSDSEAVRTALREAAARRRVRSSIRAEVRRLAADDRDREEMRIIREQLAELAPPLAD